MTSQAITKEIIKEVMAVKGEVRGIVFKTDADFVLKEKGKESLKAVEEELARIGYPINYQKLKTMNFYPLGVRVLSLLVIKKVCHFSNKDIERMGAYAPKASFVVKLFARFFFSVAKTAEQAPKMWRKHYTIGRLTAESHEKERYTVVRLHDLTIHPILCSYLSGYFATIVQMVVNAPVKTTEIKCSHRGDEYHEFLMKW